MIQAIRLGHVTFATPDIQKQVEYYRSVLGLSLLHQESRGAVLATKQGQEAIVLEQGDKPHLVSLSFELAPGTDLADVQKTLAAAGVKSERREGLTPGASSAVLFEDPRGMRVELFSDYRFAPEDRTPSVLTPLKLGHVADRVADVHMQVKFYTELLGFKVSDWRMDVFAFLRCCPDHHTVNFLTFNDPGLHHIAFEMKDFGELNRACDHIAKSDLKLEWGPARHVIGHNVACYHRNTDGLLIELFCELDRMAGEELGYFEPRPWHQDRPQRPRVWGPEWPRNYWNGEIAPWAAQELKKVG